MDENEFIQQYIITKVVEFDSISFGKYTSYTFREFTESKRLKILAEWREEAKNLFADLYNNF